MNFLKLAKTWSGAWRLCTGSDWTSKFKHVKTQTAWSTCHEFSSFQNKDSSTLASGCLNISYSFLLILTLSLLSCWNYFIFFGWFSCYTSVSFWNLLMTYTSHLNILIERILLWWFSVGFLFQQLTEKIIVKGKTKDSIHIYSPWSIYK